jgi:saccharopine dehydrogenase-like NADP-dependent oxidoreductase
MQLQNSNVLILGGFGLVGTAICHSLMRHNPASIIIASLKKEEAESACDLMRQEYPNKDPKMFIPK